MHLSPVSKVLLAALGSLPTAAARSLRSNLFLENASSSGNAGGSNNGVGPRANVPPPHSGHTASSSCTVVVGELLDMGSELSPPSIDCVLSPSDMNGYSGLTRKIKPANANQASKLREMWETNQLVSGVSILEHGAGVEFDGKEIKLPPGLNVQEGIGNGNPNGSNGVNNGSRRLTSTVGDKPILAVRVTDVNGKVHPHSASLMSDNIFGSSGDSVNLKTQLEACSFDKLSIIPGDNGDVNVDPGLYAAPGVLEVEIDVDITTVESRFDVQNAVTVAVQDKLGISLPGPYDQVMYVLEGCYGEDCGWAAYAYINSWNSVYHGIFYYMTGVQVHELGHNMNLAHSGGLNEATYTDHTCMMGNPLFDDDVGRMCFNSAKNWQLDWYDSNGGKKYIDPNDNNWNHQQVDLVGVAEYDIKAADQPVTIKLETGSGSDYFIGFNRKVGVNRDVVEGGDTVTIVKVPSGDGTAYSQSYLKATLGDGQSYTISDVSSWGSAGLTVSVKEIDIRSTPGVASLCISKTGNCNGNSGGNPGNGGNGGNPNPKPTTPAPNGGAIDDSALCGNTEVANVFLSGDTATTFGCTAETAPTFAFDANVNAWECTKESGVNDKHGFIVYPSNGDRSSIVEKLRVYSSENCPECDPVTYKVEGRGGPNCFRVANLANEDSKTFRLIRKGDLLWDTPDFARNDAGVANGDITSSNYDAGDPGRTFTEVDLLNTESECSEYRITFKATRDFPSASSLIKVGEVELVGRITNECSSSLPTANPTRLPTSSPTVSAKPSISHIPSLSPSTSLAPSCGTTEEANILKASDTVATIGCTSATGLDEAIDGTTSSFECEKDPTVTDGKYGIIVTPSDETRSSIAEKLRVYAPNDCEACDPIGYKVEGRDGPNCFRSFDNLDIGEIYGAYKLIDKGELLWNTTDRNAPDENIVIDSSYSSGDTGKVYTEIEFPNPTAECIEYRITFDTTRDVSTALNVLKFGEVELVGRIRNSCGPTAISSAPTRVPTSGPTASARPSVSVVPTAGPSISSAPTCTAVQAANVLRVGDTVATTGCLNEVDPSNAFDGTTNSFECEKDQIVTDGKYGIIVTPADGLRSSVAEKLRVYAPNDCAACDPIEYKVEGRDGPNCFRSFDSVGDITGAYKVISKGNLLWNTSDRNALDENMNIESGYALGDTSKVYTEVDLENTDSECIEYRITFSSTRNDSNTVKVGEVELVGRVRETCIDIIDCASLARRPCKDEPTCQYKKNTQECITKP